MRGKVLLLVLLSAMAGMAGQSARAASSPPDLVIDNFTAGPYNKPLTSGTETSYQTGSSNDIIGGVRLTWFTVSQNAGYGTFNRPALLDIPLGGPMLMEAGLKAYFGVYFSYGYDIRGNVNPLNLDLMRRGYDRFRINFDSSDMEMGYLVEVWDGDGDVTLLNGENSTANRYYAFYADFPFADFSPGYPGPINWDDIDHIVVLFQSGSAVGANDFAVNSIVAMPTPTP